MRSIQEETIKAFVKARLLSEGKRWSYHGVKNPDLVVKEKEVHFDSTSHLRLLRNTLDHLLALRAAYPSGSATRHIISQTCTRLKRVISRLEKNL